MKKKLYIVMESSNKALIDAVDEILKDALDNVDIHPCDENNDEIKSRKLTAELKRLYDARKALKDDGREE